MTIFRGRMDRYLRGILTISQGKKGATNTFAERLKFPRVCHKTARMIWLKYKIHLKSCPKYSIMTIFLGRTKRHLRGI